MKLAINGFGRIGRNAFRIALSHPEVEVVAINDLTDNKTLAHLLKYDSLYGVYDKEVRAEGTDKIIVDGKVLQVYAEKDPTKLPWGALGVDVVLECTGVFLTQEKCQSHITAGAKKVVMSAPSKDKETNTYVLGVNEESYQGEAIVSNASCTTNCLAPLVKVLNDTFGVERGLLTTVHSYTQDQRLHDAPHDDLRRARAAAESIVPTSTGAAKAVTLVIPELKGKLDGFSLRVPTPVVSITDFVATLKKTVTVEEVNAAFEKAAVSGPMKGILAVSHEPLVSMDYRGNPYSSIIDLLSTYVIDGNMVKVVSWYDNEFGYSNRLVDLALFIMKK